MKNKMKNKMKKLEKLNSAARDAYITYSSTVDSRAAAYSAWDDHTTPGADCENALAVYSDACRITDATWATYIAACEAARKVGDAFNANAYEAEVDKMDTNIMIPRFITLTPINEEFEAKFNTINIIRYASNGKNCVVHLLQGSSIKTLIVEESVQDIMELIGDK